MKVLVTGAAGFIGSCIVKQLEEQGVKVVALDDFSHANFQNLHDCRGQLICADVSDKASLTKLPKVDAVIHEAAITDTTLKDDTKMVTVNFNGFLNILAWCLQKNARLVYASSAGVYGGGTSPMAESQKPTPLNTYGYSKYLCDREVIRLGKKLKIPIIGLRYFNVYGPGEHHKLQSKSASMIYQLYLQVRSGKQPRVFKYGEQQRDFIYVKDVAAITIRALESKKSAILNVGTGKARSFNDIISILNKELGKKLKPEYFDNPYANVYQDHTQADTSLLQQTLKIKARYSLERGIADYVKFLEL